KRRRLRASDILAVIICLSGALIAFIFFWQDLNTTLTKGDEKPIGIVTYKDKTAQRRFGNRVVWEILKRETSVYKADLIHTSDQAEATVTFVSGAYIEMSENSLVQIFLDDDGYPRADAVNGVIKMYTTDGSAELNLVNSDTRIRIDKNSSVSSVGGTGSDTGIQILTGSASFIRKGETEKQVSAGESFEINSDGRIVDNPSTALISPNQGQVFLTTNKTISINFSWRTSNFSPEDFARFEVSSNQKFTSIVQSADVRNAQTQTAALGPGSYWWRVYASRNGTASPEMSSANKIVIMNALAPVLVSPADDQEIVYRKVAPNIRLQWNFPETGSSAENSNLINDFLIEVSRNARIENPIIREQVKTNFLITDDLDEGLWYWRVRPVYNSSWIGAAENLNFSPVFSFSLKQNIETNAAPVLIAPNDAAYINVSQGVRDTLFTWKSTREAASYNFELADNLDFIDPIISRQLSVNRFSYTASSELLHPPLVYFWRVNYTDSDGTVSPYTTPRYFSAMSGEIIFESIFPPDAWTVSSGALGGTVFSCKNNVNSESRIQIASNEDFSAIVIDRTFSGTNYELNLANAQALNSGKYFWRLLTSYNDVELKSAARNFTVTKAENIRLVSPAPDAVINGLSALRNPPVLSWSSNEPLSYVRIVLSREKDPLNSRTSLLDIENPLPSVPCPPLQEGTYYWAVKALSKSGVDISSSPYSFNVQAVSRLTAPAPMLPASGAVFDSAALRAKRSIDFSWSAVSGANGYILSLYKASDRKTAVFVSGILNETKWNLKNLSLLDLGEFVWQVEAVSRNSEGAIEQRGSLSTSNFKINIKVPETPKLQDERTYGN
ncbi:MAG: hypothetical protein LBV52_06260, partial [Spirochaetaceae bacterium]|nr:hypothetical protein [Spirochaetaceae bacterium]